MFSNATVESQDYTRGGSRKREYCVTVNSGKKREQREQRFCAGNNYDNKSPVVTVNGATVSRDQGEYPKMILTPTWMNGTSIPKTLTQQSR